VTGKESFVRIGLGILIGLALAILMLQTGAPR